MQSVDYKSLGPQCNRKIDCSRAHCLTIESMRNSITLYEARRIGGCLCSSMGEIADGLSCDVLIFIPNFADVQSGRGG